MHFRGESIPTLCPKDSFDPVLLLAVAGNRRSGCDDAGGFIRKVIRSRCLATYKLVSIGVRFPHGDGRMQTGTKLGGLTEE